MGVKWSNIQRSYRQSFGFVRSHWRLLGLIYTANLLFAIIAIAPLGGLVKTAFGD